jgi:hypothetical protein
VNKRQFQLVEPVEEFLVIVCPAGEQVAVEIL